MKNGIVFILALVLLAIAWRLGVGIYSLNELVVTTAPDEESSLPIMVELEKSGLFTPARFPKSSEKINQALPPKSEKRSGLQDKLITSPQKTVITDRFGEGKSEGESVLLKGENPIRHPGKQDRLKQRDQGDQTGTRFTKVDYEGKDLEGIAIEWECARDKRTGLLWETKSFDGGVGDVEHHYSWYSPKNAHPGRRNHGQCFRIECDTYSYVTEINKEALCGSSQWRLPSYPELRSLLDFEYSRPVINHSIFLNASNDRYWTSTQIEFNPEMIMQINFFDGVASPAPNHYQLAIRLVSD